MGGGDGEIEAVPIKVRGCGRGQQLMMERISSPLVFFIMSQDLLLVFRTSPSFFGFSAASHASKIIKT